MKARSWKTLVSIVCAMWSLAWISPGACEAQSAGVPQAVVEAIKGTATVTVDQDEEPVVLGPKSVVKAWNMVGTDEASKLLLNWSSGILSSLGPFTSLFLTSNQTDRGPLDCFQMTEGILRVTIPAGGRPVAPYMVATPVAQIEQVNPDEPVDFIVEVHDPATTNVTVIAGTVRVRNITLNQPAESVVSPCQNVYVEKARPTLDIAALTADDMNGLVEASTITGSIATTFMCPAPSVQLPPPPPSSSYVPSYAYEDWGSYDVYPFDEITIAPPQPGVGCVVVLPWIGRWVIPVDAFVGWRFDPVLMRIYCRRVVMDHIMYCDRYYLTDMTLRRRQLRHMVYLAQLSGNRDMLLDAQRKLADINVRSHWATMRLKRLEGNMSALEKEQQKFAHNMPQGQNVFQAISHSFNSPKNLAVARDFRNQVTADLAVQSQLARLTGKEAYDLRARIAREKNPRQRMALQEQLAKFNRDVAQGKIPIPAQDAQLKQAVNRLVKERDPKKLKDVEKQFDRVAKIGMPHTSEVLNQSKLNALKQNLAKYPNADKRRDLEQQVSQLQRSVDARVSAEQNIRKIDTIADEASRQQDPRKRTELLGQLKALSQPAVPAAGLAAGLHQLGQRQLLQTQLSLEKDKQTRATLEKTLEEQRKLQSDFLRQHQVQPQNLVPTQKHQQELRKQTEQQRPEHRLPQPSGQVMPLQPGQPDLKKQQADQLRKQKEQTDRMRLQQEQSEKLRQKEQSDRQRHQQEQADQLRKQKEQTDRMRLQQEQSEKLRQKEQSDRQRHQQEQADQLRKQKEQTDRMRLQQEQSEKLRQKEQSDRQRHQQEQADQLRKQKEQTDRMRLQQEQSERLRQKEQADRQRRQQEQADQLRRQKEQTDRMRQQQEQSQRLRQQQEQAERARMQQKQMEQMKQQQQQTERLRHQQEQAERARTQQKQMEQMRQHQNRPPEEDPRRKFQPR